MLPVASTTGACDGANGFHARLRRLQNFEESAFSETFFNKGDFNFDTFAGRGVGNKNDKLLSAADTTTADRKSVDRYLKGLAAREFQKIRLRVYEFCLLEEEREFASSRLRAI